MSPVTDIGLPRPIDRLTDLRRADPSHYISGAGLPDPPNLDGVGLTFTPQS